MRATARAAAVTAVLTLPACARNGDTADAGAPAPGPPAVEQPPLPEAPPDRPPVRQDMIHIEGTPEPVELRLVRSPATFPIPFTTYAPSDFVAEAARRGNDPAVRFIAVFGGQRNEGAFMEIVAYPLGLAETDALTRARQVLRKVGDGAEPVPADGVQPRWAIRTWRIQGNGSSGMVLGRVSVGRHGVRYFHVLCRYPAEYADGFGPRARVILDEWRWSNGSTLQDGTGATRGHGAAEVNPSRMSFPSFN